MAQTQKTAQPTKKHLARLQRERIYRRYLIIATVVVLVAIVGIILYGVLKESVFQPMEAVASVDNQKITTKDWQAQTRFSRSNLVRNAIYTYQFAQSFSDPAFASSLASQLQQIQQQLEPSTVGKQVLEQMVDDIIIRKEAEKLGISVSEEDINQAFQEAFEFYPDGTPTSVPTYPVMPTSTMSSLQMTLVPPTPTPTITPTPVVTETVAITPTATATATLIPTATATENPIPTATSLPTATATPYTLEGYQDLYKQTVAEYQTSYQVNESNLRYVITSQLFRQKVREAIVSDLPKTRQEVWARHILVDDEALAKDLYTQISNGADFCTLAKDNSKDDSNAQNCGDLGWFSSGTMVAEFENATFALQPGEISQPVKTDFGWHIIQVLGNEERLIPEAEYSQLQSTKFDEWLAELRNNFTIEYKDIWQDRVPTTPVFPAEIADFIQSALQSQNPTIELTPQP